MKVVLDTNVWISGLLLPSSLAGKILADWNASKFNVVTSAPILDELKRVLLYPKIRKRIQWSETQVGQYVTTLQFLTDYCVFDGKTCSAVVSKDANDTPVLQTLIFSQADYLVTGDSDLLELKNQYSIVTLIEFGAMS